MLGTFGEKKAEALFEPRSEIEVVAVGARGDAMGGAGFEPATSCL
jgi:hypothetical protein